MAKIASSERLFKAIVKLVRLHLNNFFYRTIYCQIQEDKLDLGIIGIRRK